jgi:hypothetical protein
VRLRIVIGAIATIALGSAYAGLAACGFPEPQIEEVGDGAQTDAEPITGNDGGGDGGLTSTRDVDAAPPIVCEDGSCDCDRDGVKAKGNSCGGLDCYDRDPDAKPNQDQFVTKPLPPDFNGDWNCDDSVTKQYEGNVANCNALTEDICKTKKGFTGPQPGCGVEAEFRVCKWVPGVPTGQCVQEALTTNFQGCK